MTPSKNILQHSLKDELIRVFVISFGVFLFVLFFQPFPLELLDYNNRLLFVTGFGVIMFALSCLILILLPLAVPRWFKISQWESGPPFFLSFLLVLLATTAFIFYIRYAGKASLSLYLMFKAFIVCLIPVFILAVFYRIRSLEKVIDNLNTQINYYLSKINELETEGEEEEMIINTGIRSEKLSVKYKNLVSVNSADNYIEIQYFENDDIEKKLVRNTLKNFEARLANRQNFIRCHRTYIVNTHFVEKLVRKYGGYTIKLKYLEEKIPVSRQYLNQVKEAISPPGSLPFAP
ncbi:MAG: LytTR family transcriptional regulator [Bacteroidales bacterium]|nr:LytTR family transcriptional regulator [Bacteroidales bacterium]